MKYRCFLVDHLWCTEHALVVILIQLEKLQLLPIRSIHLFEEFTMSQFHNPIDHIEYIARIHNSMGLRAPMVVVCLRRKLFSWSCVDCKNGADETIGRPLCKRFGCISVEVSKSAWRAMNTFLRSVMVNTMVASNLINQAPRTSIPQSGIFAAGDPGSIEIRYTRPFVL